MIKEFLDLCGTPHNLTLAYSKQENAIVERVNEEVNKHLRGLVFDKQTLEGYAKSIPSVSRCTGVCPTYLLFGNKLDLNRGILTPPLSVGTQSRSTYISDLISVEDKVLDTAVQALLKADAKNAASAGKATVFHVG